MFARFDEIQAIILQDIEESKRYRRTDTRTDGQSEHSLLPTKTVCGGSTNTVCGGMSITLFQ